MQKRKNDFDVRLVTQYITISRRTVNQEFFCYSSSSSPFSTSHFLSYSFYFPSSLRLLSESSHSSDESDRPRTTRVDFRMRESRWSRVTRIPSTYSANELTSRNRFNQIYVINGRLIPTGLCKILSRVNLCTYARTYARTHARTYAITWKNVETTWNKCSEDNRRCTHIEIDKRLIGHVGTTLRDSRLEIAK